MLWIFDQPRGIQLFVYAWLHVGEWVFLFPNRDDHINDYNYSYHNDHNNDVNNHPYDDNPSYNN